MGEQRIEAALGEATDTRNVNIGVGALASVPGTFLEGFGDGPAVVVADGTLSRSQAERSSGGSKEPGTP